MMVQEASNLWNGFGAHSRQFKIFSGEFSNSFIRFERFMLCKQLGSKGPECVLMDKTEGTYTFIVNYEFQK
jgi:hypothetical protein